MLHRPELTGCNGNEPMLNDYYYYLAIGEDLWKGSDKFTGKEDEPNDD